MHPMKNSADLINDGNDLKITRQSIYLYELPHANQI